MELIVPTVLLPPAIPFTFQVTVVTPEFCTVAVNCRTWPSCTLALEGETVTVTGGGLVSKTDALPIAVGVALLAACTVTVPGTGIAAGAV